MIDLHTHILPATDDGPTTVEESLAALSLLAREGVTDIVLTPHFGADYTAILPAELQARAHGLQRLAKYGGIPVRLSAGHEVDVHENVEELVASGTVATINDGPYVLFNLSSSIPIGFVRKLTSRLRFAGYIPIFSHIEQYTPAQADTEELVPVVDAGGLLMVTACSFLGRTGEVARQTAEMLLRRNMVHVIASGTRAAEDSRPEFLAGVRVAARIAGVQAARDLVGKVPQTIIRGDPFQVPPVRSLVPRNARSFWGFNR